MHALVKTAPIAVYRFALGSVIVLGSLGMWVGIPAFWIWVIGQLISEYPSIYMLASAACPLTMILAGWALYRVNRVYVEMFQLPADAPGTQRSAWLGSLSAERKPRRREPTLLDVSMVVSVMVALTAIVVWFFAFAHNIGPLPD
jgi:hypothetical protein